MSTHTSFQKKTKSKSLQIPGTKPSLHNNQLLVSTGIPSLDNLIGGGVAVGTVLLIEEDTFGSYSRLMLKYFLAEGAVCKHGLFLASADVTPASVMKELPGPLVDDPGISSNPPPEVSGDNLKIAWRYQHMPQVQSAPGGVSKFGNYYDLTKTMDAEILESVSQTLHDASADPITNKPGEVMRPSYARLLKSVKYEIDTKGYGTSGNPSAHRNILRIGIHSLGSPQWGEIGSSHSHSMIFDPKLTRFLIALRAVMRQAFAVCVITMPTHLFHDTAFTRRIEASCDTVLRLDSFAGSDKEKNPAFREYHGLFELVKLPRLNSLTCHMPDTLDLAFKLKRKKFMIEKLHLPPELSDTASRDQEDPLQPARPSLSCGTPGGSSRLDF